MDREDLPKGYDGWQALDPTPQEKSDGTAPLDIHDQSVSLKKSSFKTLLLGSS
jgi:hypothetical protein